MRGRKYFSNTSCTNKVSCRSINVHSRNLISPCLCLQNRLLFSRIFIKLSPIDQRYIPDFSNQIIALKHAIRLSIGVLLLLLIAGCDDISTPESSESAVLGSLSISPNIVEFDATSPIGNTQINISLGLTLTNASDGSFRYTVERRGLLITEGQFSAESDTDYSANLQLSVNTVTSTSYTIHAYKVDDISGEKLQGGITIKGRNVSPPVMLDAFNTEEATIPQEGNEQIDFFARAEHPDNQDFIDGVYFFLIDQQGNRLGDNFEMFDDGVINIPEGRIDEVAGDSLYSRAFFINPGNSPDDISVFYFAVGTDGQSSDTLQTQLRIVE